MIGNRWWIEKEMTVLVRKKNQTTILPEIFVTKFFLLFVKNILL